MYNAKLVSSLGCATASKQVTKKHLTKKHHTKLKPVQKILYRKMREIMYPDQLHEVIWYYTCIKFDIKKLKSLWCTG